MMRIFLNKSFAKFVHKQGIPNSALVDAVSRAQRGQIDADLGGGVIKQRIARASKGRSGGYRTIILYHSGNRAFFAYGFGKNERDNIDDTELANFKKLAVHYLSLSEAQLAAFLLNGLVSEIAYGEEIQE